MLLPLLAIAPLRAPLLSCCAARRFSAAAASPPMRASHASALPVMMVYDSFGGMKRADLPLDEELVALQVLGGCIGYVLGPKLGMRGVGLRELGIGLGVVGARWLAFAPGRRGACAREIGHQLAQLRSTNWKRIEVQLMEGSSLRAKLAKVRLPEDVKSSLAGAARKAWGELRALDAAVGMSASIRDAWAKLAAALLGWFEAKGLSGRARDAWQASRVKVWLEDFESRVEQRQLGKG